MKLRIVSPRGCPLVLLVLCLAALNTWARPPRAREACGLLQNIDLDSRSLTLKADKEGRPLEVVWTGDTRFLKDWKFDAPTALKPGMRACVYYRSPFFGKPFVTKVTWTSNPSPSTGQREKL